MAAAGSGAPNTALPATMTFAPASAAASMVAGARPPSTWMSKSGYLCRSERTFGIISG